MTVTVRRRSVIGAFAIGVPRAYGLIVTLAPRGTRADPFRHEHSVRLQSTNTMRPANVGGARGKR